jgi:hypothetical protein
LDNVKVLQRLLEKKILVSVRYTSNVGGIRVSCHFYNSPEDIETLLTQLRRLLQWMLAHYPNQTGSNLAQLEGFWAPLQSGRIPGA